MTDAHPRSAIEALYVERLAVFLIEKHDNEGFCSTQDCPSLRNSNGAIFRDPDARCLNIEDWGDFLWSFLKKDMVGVLGGQDAATYYSILAAGDGILYDAKLQQEAIARIYETSGRLLNLESWHKHLKCLTNTAATNALRISGIRLAHLLMVNEEKWAQFINAPTEMQSVFRDSSASADASIFDSSYGGPLGSNGCSSLANIPAWARRMPSGFGQENEGP